MRTFALAGLILLLVAGAAQAGTAEDPEIVDSTEDVVGPGGSPACAPPPGGCTLAPGFANLRSGWVMLEGDDLVFRIDAANSANSYGESDYIWHFVLDGTDYSAGLHAPTSGSGDPEPTGAASEAAWVDTVITITVPLANVGNPTGGAVITSSYLTSALRTQGQGTYTDRAPDEGFGRDYPLPLDEDAAGNTTGNATGNGTDDVTGNATGNMTEEADEPADDETMDADVGGDDQNSTAGAGDDNATAAPQEESPGLAPAVLVATLGAVAVLRRRRP